MTTTFPGGAGSSSEGLVGRANMGGPREGGGGGRAPRGMRRLHMLAARPSAESCPLWNAQGKLKASLVGLDVAQVTRVEVGAGPPPPARTFSPRTLMWLKKVVRICVAQTATHIDPPSHTLDARWGWRINR
jgi:hypothetical protein